MNMRNGEDLSTLRQYKYEKENNDDQSMIYMRP